MRAPPKRRAVTPRGDPQSLAKTSAPRLSRAVARERIFSLFDRALEKPVLWLSAPAGAGKTTAVKSYLEARRVKHLWYQVDERDGDLASLFFYLGKAAPASKTPLPLLTPEFAGTIALFSRRFFDALYARLAKGHRRGQRPFTLVFDNYHQVPIDSGFHTAMQVALSAVPHGVSVIVASRTDAPPELSRLSASGTLSRIGWDALRLEAAEARAVLKAESEDRLSDAAISRIHLRTDGWAAGLLLFARSAAGAAQHAAPFDFSRLERMSDGEVFDYFANELFDRAAPRVRDFLLKTAFVPRLTPAIAEALTGDAGAGSLLAELHRSNTFTERHHDPELSYQYHPLFREFLAARAKADLGVGPMRELQVHSAQAAQAAGFIEDAADLFIETRSDAALNALVVAHAKTLVSQGRLDTLARWLRALGDSAYASEPWPSFWRGVCSFAKDPHASVPEFTRAYDGFVRQGAVAGIFMAWAGAVESILFGWNDFARADVWLDRLDALLASGLALPEGDVQTRVTAVMLSALTLRRPQHPHMALWAQRGLEALHSTADLRAKGFLSVYLALYFLWTGDHAGAERVTSLMVRSTMSADAAPLARLVARVSAAVYYARLADHPRCMQVVEEGLAIADQLGLHAWDSQLWSQAANSCLCAGEPEAAQKHLEKMRETLDEARRVDACMYHYNVAWSALLARDITRANQSADAAMAAGREAGTPFHQGMCHVGLAQVRHERGDLSEARQHLVEAQAVATAMKSRILDFMIALCEAHFALGGDEAEFEACLRRAFAIGKANGYQNIYWWRADVMSTLAAQALERDIETRFVQELIVARKLTLEPRSSHLESWPWRVRVRGLGRFELEREGAKEKAAGTGQKKPLELLQVLIALGGRGVPVDTLVAELWPDADGDLAQISFDTTLHRLRRTLGDKRLLELREGRLSLDQDAVWVDAWAFQSMLDRVDAPKTSGGERRRLLVAAVELYRGHFLEEYSPSWALAPRERLRARYVRAVCALGGELEGALQVGDARALYQTALEVDDASEALHRKLIALELQQGRRAEAQSALRRCRRVLQEKVGAGGSVEFASLARELGL